MSLSYREVQERLRIVGVALSKRGHTIRINYFGGSETTASYADNLQDALDLGLKMARPETLPARWLSARKERT